MSSKGHDTCVYMTNIYIYKCTAIQQSLEYDVSKSTSTFLLYPIFYLLQDRCKFIYIYANFNSWW